jgi:hypothetical protein
MTKIAILYTTFLRDELMQQTVQSILDNWKHYYTLFIADQGNPSEEKNKFYQSLPQDQVYQWYLPYNCGISFARNFLIDKAIEKHCEFCIITADSIKFTSRYYLEPYLDFLNNNKNAGIVGFDIENRIPWEYYMKKTHIFELIPSNDFVDYNYLRLKKVDIVRNFFLVKTNVLYENKWDDNLKMAEHEDFFYQLKIRNNYQVFYSNLIQTKYITFNYPEYTKYRKENFTTYRKEAIKKWKISDLFRIKK